MLLKLESQESPGDLVKMLIEVLGEGVQKFYISNKLPSDANAMAILE